MAYTAGALLIFIGTQMLSACSLVTYRHGPSEFTRMTIGTDTEIQGLRVTVGSDGSRTLELDAVSAHQSQAIEAAARGAAAGAIRGVGGR